MEAARRREEEEKLRHEVFDRVAEEHQREIEEQQHKMAQERLKMIDDQVNDPVSVSVWKIIQQSFPDIKH